MLAVPATCVRGQVKMPKLLHLVVVASCLSGTALATAPTSQYVTSEDLTFRADADTAAGLWCDGYESGDVSEADGRQSLEDGVGGENIILESLTAAEDAEDVQTELQERADPTSMWMKAFPIVAAVLLIVIWCFMCCTACPCKRCGGCRCCKRAWDCPGYMKAVALAGISMCFVGLLICVSMAFDGANAANGGIAGLACTSARLVNNTYAGGGAGNTVFMGILPTLEAFDTLDGKLDDGSQFMTDINVIIDSTESIDNAVMVASRTLTLLRDMLQYTANADPKNDAGNSLGHDGLLSASNGLPAVLTPAIEALDTGVAVALQSARQSAKDQLSTANRQEIQSQLRNAISPLNNVKTSMRSTFSSVTDPSIHDQWNSGAALALTGWVMVLFIIAILANCCGCASIGCCIKSDEGNNHVHRCACTSWCCNFYIAVLALFTGGLMLLIAVPISGVCLILTDIDREMLNGIGDAISMNMSGDEGVMLGDMVERCFNPADVTAPANLMDILFERNETTGQRVTLRDKMISQFSDQIESQFDQVTARLNSNLPSLAADSRIVALRQALQDNPIDKMFLPQSTLTSNTNFEALDPNNANAVSALSTAALNSSADCDDHWSALIGRGVGGISAFLTELQALGSSPTAITNGISCTQTVTCTAGATSAACEAGNRLMYYKAALQNTGAFDAVSSGTSATNNYRCDLFTIPSNSNCDVLNMPASNPTNADMCVAGSAGSYSMTTTTNRQCDLAGLTTYISDFDSRLEKVFANVDTITDSVRTAIDTDLRNTLDTHVMNPLDAMADSMQCNFLAPLYADLVNSFCYQGMWGFRRIAVSYTTLGFLQVLLIPLMYTIYRLGRDKLDDPTLTQKTDSI
jgi:hypothetical protein